MISSSISKSNRMKCSIRGLVCMVFLFLIVSCRCSKLSYVKNPIFSESSGYSTDFCKEDNIAVGFARKKERYAKQYILPNDSIAFGYTAGMNFLSRIQADTIVTMRVGKGSEFGAGGCTFRVVRVEYGNRYNSDTMTTRRPFVLFQTLKLPNYCWCQNKKLRKFDEKMKDPVFYREATSFGIKKKEEEE